MTFLDVLTQNWVIFGNKWDPAEEHLKAKNHLKAKHKELLKAKNK